jgi:hypothetical protein
MNDFVGLQGFTVVKLVYYKILYVPAGCRSQYHNVSGLKALVSAISA